MTQEFLAGPPAAGNELDTLLGALERNRRVFAWKCEGLDAAAMSVTVGTSAITIGGLLRHLAEVEGDSFSWKLHGHKPDPIRADEDWDRDWAWTADDDPEAVWRQWRTAVERSRELVADAVDDGGLDRAKGPSWPDGRIPSLRRIVVDMIEEYARHTGHADLIRESIDGRVGEDAPL